MSRWGDSTVYERDRILYESDRPGTRTREYDEVDIASRNSRSFRREPEFLREDRGHTAGPLVRVHDDDFDRPRRRDDRVEREEVVFRDARRPLGSRTRQIVEEADLRSVRSGRSARSERIERVDRDTPRGGDRSREEIDIRIRKDEDERPRERHREHHRDVVDEGIVIRKSDRDRPRSVVGREDTEIRRDEVERSRRRREGRKKEEVMIRRSRSRSSSRSPVRHHHRNSSARGERIVSRGPPPKEGLIARKHEEFVIRRPRKPERSPSSSPSRSPSPREKVREEIVIKRKERSPSPREEVKEEIIIKRKERSPSPREEVKEEIIIKRTERSPSREPIIDREVIRRPIVHEQIHRDIIETVTRRERSPSPIIEPEPEVHDEKLEIAIRRTDDKGTTEEDIIIEDHKHDDRRHHRSRSRAGSVGEDVCSTTDVIIGGHDTSISSRSRSRHRHTDDYDLDEEADYYNRRAMERATVGEAYQGATRDWAVVDVPPGTSRVKMDGIGGGSQEITWQRYNGARRSRFRAGGHDFVAYPDFEPDRLPEPLPGVAGPEPAVDNKSSSLEISIRDKESGSGSGGVARRERRPREMWTEITKDLVIREAIEELGYGYEETEYYFYVMDYLQYDDVLRVVKLSDDMRRRRRHRIREIEFERERERERFERPVREERFERDIVFERRRRH